MSFSLLRSPKKAAMTALRGLIAGTSCVLLLIIDDRPRRINLARRMLRNAERIRSSRHYHATRPVLDSQSTDALNGIEGVVYSGGAVQRHGQIRGRDKDNNDARSGLPTAPNQPEQDASISAVVAPSQSRDDPCDWQRAPGDAQSASNQQSGPARDPAPLTRVPLPRAGGFQASMGSQQPDPGMFRRPVPIKVNSVDMAGKKALSELQDMDILARVRQIQQAALAVAGLADSVDVLGEVLQKKHMEEEEKSALVQTAVMLCVRCQNAGLMDHAERALYYLVSLGPVTEAAYYASRPKPVIKRALFAVEAEMRVSRSQRQKRIHILRNRLDQALKLLMPIFTEGTLSPWRVQEWLPMAHKALYMTIGLDMCIQAANLYWRIQHYDADQNGRVTLRFLKYNLKRGRHRRVLNAFSLVRHRLVHYDADAWYHIGDLVTTAVENAAGHDPAKLLKTMTEFCPEAACLPEKPLRTTWVTKLMYCHWQRTNDFEQSHALFQQFKELGGLDKTIYEDGPYRVMIQVAVEAEQWLDVDVLLKRVRAIKPSSIKEARIIGLVALAKAMLGDWNGVWEEFKRVVIKDRIEDVFTAVLHEFIKRHTTEETEDFLKSYIQGLGMPISSFMVNMVANRYGDVRDARSFVGWLSYCSSRGFQIDSSFGNAILTNCRRRWDFDLQDLKLIYRTLHALNPDFVDGVTENDMIASVLRTHRRAKPVLIQREVDSAGLNIHERAASDNLEDIRVGMRHAFVTRNYKHALFLYKSATKRGLRMDDGHLRLAVKSSLGIERRIQAALILIKDGREKGIDVTTCITPVFLSQLRRVYRADTSDKDAVLRQVESIIARFELNDLSLGHQDLLRAAYLLLQAKHYGAAVSFGLSALQRKGITHPDDVPTFQLLIQAYAFKGDARGMRWTLAGAVHSGYYHKKGVYTALKHAQKLLMRQIMSHDIKMAMRVLEEGLDKVRQVRMTLKEERKGLERATIDIMKDAAVEAGPPKEEGALKRHFEILEELEQQLRKEEEDRKRTEDERKAEMEARHRAVEEAALANKEAAEDMEQLMVAKKHEIPLGF